MALAYNNKIFTTYNIKKHYSEIYTKLLPYTKQRQNEKKITYHIYNHASKLLNQKQLLLVEKTDDMGDGRLGVPVGPCSGFLVCPGFSETIA